MRYYHGYTEKNHEEIRWPGSQTHMDMQGIHQ